MRRTVAALVALLLPAVAAAQPSPTFLNPHVSGTLTGGTISGNTSPSTTTPAGGTTARTEADLHGDFVRATSFGAKFDGVRVASGGSMTISTNVLRWSGGSFAATDVGKLVAVDGAGLNGRPLVATITGYTSATQVTLSTTALSTVPTNILAWKSGYQGGPTVSAAGAGYAPGDLITLTGGTATYQGVLQVVGTKAITATVVAGGASGTPGACTITGTTGNANGTTTLFQATGTVSGGGALSGALVVTVAGEYRDNPTDITAEPVTSNCGLVGTTVALTMGVVDTLVQQPGAYSVKPSDPISQGSTTGGGSGATFTGVWSTTGAFHYGTDNGAAVQAAITYCQSQVVNNAGGCSVLLPIGTGLTSTTLTVNKSNVSLYSLSRSVGFQMRNNVAANNESFPTRLLYAGADNPGYMLTQVPLLADGHRLAGVDVVGIMFDCAGTQGCGGISIRSATYSTYNASVNEPYPRAYTISGAVASGTRAVVVTDATGVDVGQNVWIPNALAGTYVESVSGNTVTLSSTVYGTGLADGASIYIGGAAWRLDVLGGLNPSDTQANNLWLYGRTSNSPGPCVTINGSAAAGSPQFGNTSLNFFRDVGCVVGAGDMVIANNSDHNYWYNFLPTFVPNTFNIGAAFISNGSLNASNGANRFNWFFNTPGRRAVTFRGTSAGGFTSASVGTQANWLLASAVPRVTVDTAGGATACLSQDTAPAIGCTGALTTTLTGAFTGTGATITGGTFSGITLSGTIPGSPILSGSWDFQGTTVVGSDTTAQILRLNGAAGSARALEWATAGVKRYHIQPNGSDNLQMLAYDSGGLNPVTVYTVTNTTGALNFATPVTLSKAFTLQPASITYAGSDSGTPGSTQPYFSSQTYTGSTTSSFNPIYNLTKIFDNVATPNDSAGSDMISFQGIPGGTAVNAGRRLLLLTMAPTAMVNSVGEFTTLQPKMFVNAASNGAAAFAINSTVEIKSTSSGWLGAIGHETDMYVEAGASQPQVKMFKFMHLVPGDAQQGSLTDAAEVLDTGPSTGLTNNGGTMRAWLQVMKNGASQWPMDATLGEFLTVGSQTQANANGVPVRPNAMLRAFNFHNINFSDSAMWWPGGWLGGGGEARFSRLKIAKGTNGPIIDATLYKATACAVSVGGSRYQAGDQVYPVGLAGIINIDTVAAGVVTGCSWVADREAYSTTNPATAATTGGTGPSQSGTDFVAAITWALASEIQLGASVNTIIGTGSALATNATSGFVQLATMAGAPTGTVGAAGKAAVVIDTTNKKICYSTGSGTWECSAAFTP